MKHLLIASIFTLSSAFAMASTFNDDLDLVWLSWCEKGNVMQSDSAGNPKISTNCEAEGKRCQDYQRTSGKRVIYSAMCVDKDDNN